MKNVKEEVKVFKEQICQLKDQINKEIKLKN